MKQGFTLIELAIVIVVVGLITVGVVGGRSIMESADRQAIIRDFSNISTAINAFYLEYGALPGDFDEAEDYWPEDGVNGDGNKFISTYLLWNHLNLSGILSNEVTITSWPHYDMTGAEKNWPPTSISGTYWGGGGFYSSSQFSKVPFHRGVVLSIIKPDMSDPDSRAIYNLPSVSPKFAYSLDKKIDDGYPTKGRIGSSGYRPGVSHMISLVHSECGENNHQTSIILDWEYNKSEDEELCVPLFLLQSRSGKLAW